VSVPPSIIFQSFHSSTSHSCRVRPPASTQVLTSQAQTMTANCFWMCISCWSACDSCGETEEFVVAERHDGAFLSHHKLHHKDIHCNSPVFSSYTVRAPQPRGPSHRGASSILICDYLNLFTHWILCRAKLTSFVSTTFDSIEQAVCTSSRTR
jgi:hypothetical protein